MGNSSGWIDLSKLIPGILGRIVHVRPVDDFDQIAETLLRLGFRVLELDGAKVKDAKTFFVEAGRALALPKHYGANWDALVDCLGDWQDGPDRRIAVLWKAAGLSLAADPQTFLDALIVIDRAAFDASASDDPVQIEIFLFGL